MLEVLDFSDEQVEGSARERERESCKSREPGFCSGHFLLLAVTYTPSLTF